MGAGEETQPHLGLLLSGLAGQMIWTHMVREFTTKKLAIVAMKLAKYDAKVQMYTAKLLYGCTDTEYKAWVTLCTNNLEQSQFVAWSLRLDNDINNVEQRAF